MKLWTGDEWRMLSENEAKHRLECGYTVVEDDDPRSLAPWCATMPEPAAAEPPMPEPPPKAKRAR